MKFCWVINLITTALGGKRTVLGLQLLLPDTVDARYLEPHGTR